MASLQVHRTNRWLTVAALACAASVVVVAQESTLQSGQLLQLFTTATDQQGQVVSGLIKDDFVVLDNDKPQTPTLFEIDVQPITAIVLIDRSASMIGTFEPLVAAVDRFVRALRPQDQVRAGTFSDKVQFTSHFTSNPDELIPELKQLAFGNGTKLHEALLASFDDLRGKPGLRVVIAITDGEDTDSRIPRSKVLERERTDNVIVYAIGLETQYFNGQQVVRNIPGRGLRELAEQTGGGYLEARRNANIAAIFARINQELHSHYLLGFVPAPGDGRVHKLAVQAKRSGITIRSRRSYVAVPSASQ